MGRLTQTQSDRATLRRDWVLALLWRSHNPGWPDGEWATSSDVYEVWRDGRNLCGCIFWDDYLKRDDVTRDLNRLCDEGRAEVSRAKGRHPWYRPLASFATKENDS